MDRKTRKRLRRKARLEFRAKWAKTPFKGFLRTFKTREDLTEPKTPDVIGGGRGWYLLGG